MAIGRMGRDILILPVITGASPRLTPHEHMHNCDLLPTINLDSGVL